LDVSVTMSEKLVEQRMGLELAQIRRQYGAEM
jgi:hypothetical protein